MRIQEMRPGFLHLKKKMEDEGPENYFAANAVEDVMIDPETGIVAPLELACELNEARWSVVSFDKMEAAGLSYVEASALMVKLDSYGVTGLCIVTDEAALRMRS
jgi:hypothetical protein